MQTVHASVDNVFKLSATERLALAQALWDSVADEVNSGEADLPLPDWQHAELMRRAALLDAGEMPLMDWDDIKRKYATPSR